MTVPTSNWAGNVAYRAARRHRPSTVDQLRQVVAGAVRVRALGTGHSFSDLAAVPGGDLEERLDPFEARPHWGKLFRTEAATLHRRYLFGRAARAGSGWAGGCTTCTTPPGGVR